MSPPLSSPPGRLPFFGATVFFAAALGLACLLSWHALAGNTRLPGCGGAADCGALGATRWAYFGPVPVALPGVVLYGAALGCLLLLDRQRAMKEAGARARAVWLGLISLSLVALGAALWFTGLQGLVLRRYCTLCLATHLCASIGGGFVLWMAAGAGGRANGLGLGPGLGRRWRGPALVAAGVLALLAGGQVVFLPRGVPVGPAAGAAVAQAAAVISEALPARDLVLAGGRVRLDASAYPALGIAPATPATRGIAVMFDYTCEACRASHGWLLEAMARGGAGRVVFMLPTPLDPACNPAVERLRPEHVNACLYARYALAVWKAAPERFAAYDAWLMAGGPAPPPIGVARRRAEELVGAEAFARALARPEIDRLLHGAGTIYQTLEAGEIPKLLLERGVVAGGFGSAAQWRQAWGE